MVADWKNAQWDQSLAVFPITVKGPAHPEPRLVSCGCYSGGCLTTRKAISPTGWSRGGSASASIHRQPAR
jgi:hypothetical protein